MVISEREVRDRSRLRRDLGWNLVPVALLAVVGLGLNFLIASWWDEAALGSFNLVTATFVAFGVIGACGFQFAALRAIAEDPTDRDRIAAIVVGALVPNVAIAAATTGLFLLLHRPIGDLLDSPAVANGMLWAAPGLFCFALNKLLLGVVNGLRRMRAFAIYTSLRYTLIAVGLVGARVGHADAAQLPAIWTFTEGVLLLVLIVELISTVALARAAGWTTWARRHLDYGVRGVLSTLALEVNSKLDIWMLGIAAPSSVVGIYSMAAALNEGAMQLAVVLQNNLNPVLARDLAAGRIGEVEALVRRTRRWFVPGMVVLCAIGAALYPLIIPAMIGKPSFHDGTVPFCIMMAGLAIASPYLPFNQLLLMASRPGWHTLYMLGIVAVNLVCTAILIPLFGLEGAALSIAASVVMSAVFLRVLARRLLGTKM